MAKKSKSTAVLAFVRGILPHLCIIMCGMLLVFFVIDRLNEHQAFLTNEFHKILIFVLSLSCIAVSVMLISTDRRLKREEMRRHSKKHLNKAE